MASNGTTCRRKTPDHPPYALMIGTAIKSLAEEGGSTEESISRFIRSHYASIPPAHDLLLPYYLDRLTAGSEFLVSAPGRYLVPPCLQEEEENDPQPPQPQPPEEEENLEEEEKKNDDPQLPQPQPEEEENLEEEEENTPHLQEEEDNDPLQQPEEEENLEEEEKKNGDPQPPQPEEEENLEEEEKKNGEYPTAEQKGEDNANIEEGLPFACKGDLVMELQPLASSPAGPKPVELPMRKRGRPSKKEKMSPETMDLPESGGDLLVLATPLFPVALERDTLEPDTDNGPRKRGRKRKKKNDMPTESVGLAESGGCGLSVPTIASESTVPERNNLEPNNEGDEPDNWPRKRGRPRKKNDVSRLAESSSCGSSVSTFASESVAPERNNLEPNNVSDEPDNSPRKRGRPPKTGKRLGRPPKNSGKDTGDSDSGGATVEKSTAYSGEKTDNGEKAGERLGRPPQNPGKKKDKGDSEPESGGTAAEKSTAERRGRPRKTEPESTGATTEKMVKRLGRPPKNSGEKKDKGEPESVMATAERCGRPRKTEPEPTRATTEKTGKRLGRPPKNSGEKKDKGEPESVMGTTERRGRPPKTKTDSGEPVFATRKRLGRHPKNSGEKTMEEKTGEQKPDDLVVESENLSSF